MTFEGICGLVGIVANWGKWHGNLKQRHISEMQPYVVQTDELRSETLEQYENDRNTIPPKSTFLSQAASSHHNPTVS